MEVGKTSVGCGAQLHHVTSHIDLVRHAILNITPHHGDWCISHSRFHR